jgi:hypothetical protein
MAFLGHKKPDNTLLYVQLDEKLFKYHDDNFTVRVAHNIGESIPLVEASFEYVTGEYTDGGKLFRRRKQHHPSKNRRNQEKLHEKWPG